MSSSQCRWFWIESQTLLLMKTAQWSVGKKTVQTRLRERQRDRKNGKTHQNNSRQEYPTSTQPLPCIYGLDWICLKRKRSGSNGSRFLWSFPWHPSGLNLPWYPIFSSPNHVKSDWVRVCKSIRLLGTMNVSLCTFLMTTKLTSLSFHFPLSLPALDITDPNSKTCTEGYGIDFWWRLRFFSTPVRNNWIYIIT